MRGPASLSIPRENCPATTRGFELSLSNSLDDRPADPPYLMRMADAIDAVGIRCDDDILDVTVKNEIHEDLEDDYWWSMSIYWSPNCGQAGG